MATSKQKMLTEYNLLTKKEKKIYKSILANFPETSHGVAIEKAQQGGAEFQFISK